MTLFTGVFLAASAAADEGVLGIADAPCAAGRMPTAARRLPVAAVTSAASPAVLRLARRFAVQRLRGRRRGLQQPFRRHVPLPCSGGHSTINTSGNRFLNRSADIEKQCALRIDERHGAWGLGQATRARLDEAETSQAEPDFASKPEPSNPARAARCAQCSQLKTLMNVSAQVAMRTQRGGVSQAGFGTIGAVRAMVGGRVSGCLLGDAGRRLLS